MRKLRPAIEMIDALVVGEANKRYEMQKENDQADYFFPFLHTGELIGLDQIVERQRQLDASFEQHILQLVAFERRKVREF